MQQKPQPPAHPQSTAASNAAEEALKRNTDCVYFLASPLTCKKGAECEYRHSELARVNPRDCWYWLNGNCLNAKCAFRHPPLDGMLVPQALTPSGPSFGPFQTAAIPVSSDPHNCSKQTVPCIFFQKGFCLKGDKCPFSHGPVINSKGPQGPVTAAAFLEPSSIKKPVGGPEKCSVELKVQETNICEATEVPLRATPFSQVESVPVKDRSAIERDVRHPSGVDVNISNPPKYRQTTPPIANGNFTSRPSRMLHVNISEDQDTLNSKDADEISREFSPGFDVLVDDELRDADYYHHEDHYERTRDNEGSYLNQGNDNDIGHSADYDSLVDVDQDAYRDPRRYDSFDQMRGGQYGRDQCQVSSERILGISEMRQYSRDDSPGRIDGSDLRYHLSKHRKVNNGLRSVISHDLDLDRYGGNHSCRGPSHRDTYHLSASERFVGDRLWGRIKLPGRSMSPHKDHDLRCEREIERGNGGGRLSPERVVGSVHHRRLRDRLKGRVRDDLNDEGRSIRGLRMRERLYDNNGEGRGFRGLQMRERSYDNNINFASPKSLAELRVEKNTENDKPPMNECQRAHPLGKRRHSGNYEQSGPGLSFPGPKPLSEILKRKRAAVGSGEDSKQNEEREDSKPAGRQSLQMKESKREEGLIVEDNAKEDQDPETYAGGDGGENKYEQIEGEEYYNEDQVENADAEYAEDDDDGDDFAKKIGVMFS